MKKTFKSFIMLIVTLCMVVSIFSINAFASGTTSVAFSKNTLNVGDTLTVTIRFKATEKMYGVEAKVQYDTKILQYVSAPNGPDSASGVVHIVAGASDKTASETVTFKAIGAGSCTVKINDALYAADDEVSVSGCSATLKVVDKSATKSSNANLKYITPSAGSLTPKFSADVTSYSITIPNNVTKLTVGAGVADSGAKWDVEGSKDMKVGSNQRVIVVTAADGTQKKYTLNITRLAADGSTPEPDTPDTENPTDEKVSVTADGKDMYILNSFDTTNLFAGFAVDVYNYNGTEFPCIKRDDTSLLYLTETDGANGGFFRPLEDGTFTAFAYLQSESKFYEFLKPEKAPEGYSEISIEIAGCKVTAYQSTDPTLTDFALVWAKGPDGYEGFYRYDCVEHTIQRATGAMNVLITDTDTDEEQGGSVIENFLGLNTGSKITVFTIIGILLLLIAAIVILIVKIARSGDDDEEYIEEEADNGFDFVTVSNRDKND